MAGNFFRGTTADQDPRWGKSDKKMMAQMEKSGNFASVLDTKVDMKKVNCDVMFKWVTEKLIDMLGFEDDIVINMIINLLEKETIDPKRMQMELTGFLEKKTKQFMDELWTLLVDAQSQPSGIPLAFIQQKKAEILKRQERKNVVDRGSGGGRNDTSRIQSKFSASPPQQSNDRTQSNGSGRNRDEDWDRCRSSRDTERRNSRNRSRDRGRKRSVDRIRRRNSGESPSLSRSRSRDRCSRHDASDRRRQREDSHRNSRSRSGSHSKESRDRRRKDRKLERMERREHNRQMDLRNEEM